MGNHSDIDRLCFAPGGIVATDDSWKEGVGEVMGRFGYEDEGTKGPGVKPADRSSPLLNNLSVKFDTNAFQKIVRHFSPRKNKNVIVFHFL